MTVQTYLNDLPFVQYTWQENWIDGVKTHGYAAVPLVVRKPDTLIFPFCVVREELEYVTKRYTSSMKDAAGLLNCSWETW